MAGRSRAAVAGRDASQGAPAGVVPPPRGLELFAPRARATPLKVSGRLARGLAKLGVSTVQDLLQHYPRQHVDRRELKTIAELRRSARDPSSEEIQVHARVVNIERPFKTRSGKRVIKGRIGDATGHIAVTWFN